MAGLVRKVPPALTFDEEHGWVLADDDDTTYAIQAEHAKTGRAKCMRCSELIPKDSVRVGVPGSKWKGKYVNSWAHAACIRIRDWLEDADTLGPDALSEKIYNFDDLSKKERQTLMAHVASRDPLPDPTKAELDDWLPSVSAAGLEPITSLDMPLLPFQRLGVAWMARQEGTALHGGILADEMGMGKTIQTIALIVHQKREAARGSRGGRGGRRGGGSVSAGQTTLVICPASALGQWREEIVRFAPDLEVLTFHTTGGDAAGSTFSSADVKKRIEAGSGEKKPADSKKRKRGGGGGVPAAPPDFSKYDVVLTTFSIVETHYREVVNGAKVECEHCLRKFLPSSLATHLKYFCGPTAKRSQKQALRETKAAAAAEKAKATLGIGGSAASSSKTKSSVPSMTNTYREIMSQAGRNPIGRYDKGERARRMGVAIEAVGHEGEDPIYVSKDADIRTLTVARVQELVRGRYGESPESQLLIFNRKRVPSATRQDRRVLLQSLGVAKGSRISVSFLKGGAPGNSAQLKRKAADISPEDDTDEDEEEEDDDDDDDNEAEEEADATPHPNTLRVHILLETPDPTGVSGVEGGGCCVLRTTFAATEEQFDSFTVISLLKWVASQASDAWRSAAGRRSPEKRRRRRDEGLEDSPGPPRGVSELLSAVLDTPGMETAEKMRKAMTLWSTGGDDDTPEAPSEIAPSQRRLKNLPSVALGGAGLVVHIRCAAPRKEATPPPLCLGAIPLTTAGLAGASVGEPAVLRPIPISLDGIQENWPTVTSFLRAFLSGSVWEKSSTGGGSKPEGGAWRSLSQSAGSGSQADLRAALRSVSAVFSPESAVGEEGRDGGRGAPPAAPPAFAAGGSQRKICNIPAVKRAVVLRGEGGGSDSSDEESDASSPLPPPPVMYLLLSNGGGDGCGGSVAEEGNGKAEDAEEGGDDASLFSFESGAGGGGGGGGDGKGGGGAEDDEDDEDDEDEDELNHIEEEERKEKEKAGRGKKQPSPGKSDTTEEGSEDDDDDDDSDDDDDDDDESSSSSSSAPPTKKRRGAGRSNGTSGAKKGKGKEEKEKAKPKGTSKLLDLHQSPLHDFKWGRLVVDEAHRMKTRTTSTAKAIYDLTSEVRWGLTGTPLQNRVGELFSLVRFLCVEPYAYYCCDAKGCNCSHLDWQFGWEKRACPDCGHPSMKHFSQFNRHILNPITKYGYIGDGFRALQTLRSLLERMQLRRTKLEVSSDVNLPPLEVVVHKGKLDQTERDFYTALYTRSEARFDGYVEKGTLLHNYAHIFELLSRLRQAVDHPYIVSTDANNIAVKPGGKKGGGGGGGKSSAAALQKLTSRSAGATTCGICGEAISGAEETSAAVKTPCRHSFHGPCAELYFSMGSGGKATASLDCPGFCCKKQVRQEQLKPFATLGSAAAGKAGKKEEETQVEGGGEDGDGEEEEEEEAALEVKPEGLMKKVDLSEFTSSTKVEDLVRYVLAMPQEDKCIVFSQFNGMLDIVKWRLDTEGVRVVKLTGDMPTAKRAETLKAFRTNPAVRGILLSLRAGGEGLNLQVANHVFTLDPWWNPAVEMQAVQRAHRIGQTKPVKAVRFITDDTIEERMYQLQEKKQLVFDGTVDGSCAALSALSGEDIAFLFNR